MQREVQVAVKAGRETETMGARAAPSDIKAGSGWLRGLPLFLLIGCTIVAFATGIYRYLSVEELVANRENLRSFVAAHPVGAPLAYAGVYVAAVALSLPGALFLTVTGGLLFGWVVGGAVTVVAATLGGVVVFLAARTSLAEPLRRRAGDRMQKLLSGFRDGAFSYLLFLRLVPFVPFWLVNIAAALFGVPLRTFALATLIGIVPGTLAFTLAGSGLDELIGAQAEAHRACLAAGQASCGINLGVKTLLTPGLLATLGALSVLSLIPVLLKRFWTPERRRVPSDL